MFIQIIQGKCTAADAMHERMDRWREECEPGAIGWLGGTYGFTDDDMFVGVVRFESEEAARRNSDRPEQTAWWRETAQLFDGQPTFHDCKDVMLLMGGGSDEAGFVQVIQGRVSDPARLRTVMEQGMDMLHEQRPDILGATIAIEDDGHFTETVAFSNEAAAREGEKKEMPEDARQLMEGESALMKDLSYLDLHHPWFASRTEGTAKPMM